MRAEIARIAYADLTRCAPWWVGVDSVVLDDRVVADAITLVTLDSTNAFVAQRAPRSPIGGIKCERQRCGRLESGGAPTTNRG